MSDVPKLISYWKVLDEVFNSYMVLHQLIKMIFGAYKGHYLVFVPTVLG